MMVSALKVILFYIGIDTLLGEGRKFVLPLAGTIKVSKYST